MSYIIEDKMMIRAIKSLYFSLLFGESMDSDKLEHSCMPNFFEFWAKSDPCPKVL